MFTANHFIWIGLCALSIVLGTLAAKKRDLSLRGAGRVMCLISLCSETSKILTHMIPSEFGGMVLDPLALPFHLCSLMIFVVAYITFGRESPLRTKVIQFAVPLCILGGIAAILIPTDGVDFRDPLAYQCFVYHAGLIWFAASAIAGGQVDLGTRAWLRNMGILLALAIAMLEINGALSAYGTNFLFVVRPPMEGLPVLNLDHGWYVYFLTLAVLGLGALTLFHLPFMLRGRKK